MWPFKNKQPEQLHRIVFVHQDSHEVKDLNGLVKVFSEYQYANKHIATSMLRTIAEMCERLAQDDKTFERELPKFTMSKEQAEAALTNNIVDVIIKESDSNDKFIKGESNYCIVANVVYYDVDMANWLHKYVSKEGQQNIGRKQSDKRSAYVSWLRGEDKKFCDTWREQGKEFDNTNVTKAAHGRPDTSEEDLHSRG